MQPKFVSDFPEPERTIQPYRGKHVVTYVRPSRMTRLGWDPGSEWATPTSLEFEADVIHSELYKDHIQIWPALRIHPSLLLKELEALWKRVLDTIKEEDRVVDQAEMLGFQFSPWDTEVQIAFEAKTWPSVPGITTPKLKEL